MGLLNWIFGRRGAKPAAAVPLTFTRNVDGAIPGPGDFEIEVVGESHYQEAIEFVAGGQTAAGCNEVVDAVLILEDSDPHDANAVQVYISGYLCGYLSRDDAKGYRRQLRAAGHPHITASCKAMIVGGWDRGPGDRGYFGVRLDLPRE